MTLLIVDDEIIAVEGIKASIEWDKVPFDIALSANSMKQAIEIFEAQEIDAMLCDIEMPGGNGLELVRWVSVHAPLTVSVILTCHDDFDFAKQALQLRCMDYLLKPVEKQELTQILQRAGREADRKRKLDKYLTHYTMEESAQPEAQNIAERCRQYIVEHIGDELKVSELAAMFYQNADYLSRKFKQKYSKSINEYINEYRIDLAAQLLVDTDLSTSAVAERVGFMNYNHFNNMFRRKYDLTPKEYRKAKRARN